jgi:DNA-binding transcriptional regulator YiaG
LTIALNYSERTSAPAAGGALQEDMPPRNAVLRSPDPPDQIDPLDQSNGKEPIDTPPVQSRRRALNVRVLRKSLNLTQRRFAGWFGFPVATLRHWERGNRRPSGTALVLLHVIHENPRLVMQAVRKARLRDPGSIATIEPTTSCRAPPGFGRRLPVRNPRRKR